MKLINKLSAATFSLLVSAQSVLAVDPPTGVGIKNPTDITSFAGLFNTIFTFIIAIIGGLAVIFIVIGGIRYILAQGDPKATDSARNQITGALIGLVIALLAVVIVNVVAGFLGASNFVNLNCAATPKPANCP